MALHFYDLAITSIQKEIKDCVVLCFAIPEALQETFTFTQGQNITLKATINGEEVRRSYSICTAPFENILAVAIKKVEQGIFSTYANEQLKVGDILSVLPPTGKFQTTLNSTHQKNYVAFACGSGITPILSIIKTTLHTETKSSFTLVYSNRNKSSIIFFEAIEALKNKYFNRFTLIHLLSREKTDAPINYGRINEEKLIVLEKLIAFNKTDDFFICGPQEMIFTTRDFLLKKAVTEKQIHFELFATNTPKKATSTTIEDATTPKSNITVKLDGRSFDFKLAYNSDSILDAAMQQGADLPFACKGGVCCTCRAKLIQGEVKMDVNYALEAEEIAQGFILTCQAHPITDTVVVDFDVYFCKNHFVCNYKVLM
jgi:ring-1,2-phenylacetyl-CoA epoxidase subunit PaaE